MVEEKKELENLEKVGVSQVEDFHNKDFDEKKKNLEKERFNFNFEKLIPKKENDFKQKNDFSKEDNIGIAENIDLGKRLEDNKKIEDVLSGGLADVYLAMNQEDRKNFKIVGEDTARKINILLNETKVKVNKILELIKKWLSLIPSVDRFFIEQEAKNKLDKIMKIKNG